jgi:hypothetical protein
MDFPDPVGVVNAFAALRPHSFAGQSQIPGIEMATGVLASHPLRSWHTECQHGELPLKMGDFFF